MRILFIPHNYVWTIVFAALVVASSTGCPNESPSSLAAGSGQASSPPSSPLTGNWDAVVEDGAGQRLCDIAFGPGRYEELMALAEKDGVDAADAWRPLGLQLHMAGDGSGTLLIRFQMKPAHIVKGQMDFEVEHIKKDGGNFLQMSDVRNEKTLVSSVKKMGDKLTYLGIGFVRIPPSRAWSSLEINYRDCITRLQRCLDQNAKDIKARRELAIRFASMGDTARAIAAFDELLKLSPKDGDALRRRADLRRKQDQAGVAEYRQSLEDYDAALQMDPHGAAALSGRGWTKHRLARMTGEEKWEVGALADLTRAASLKNSPITINRLGVLKLDAGVEELGIEEFTRAIQIDPRYHPAYFNRGLARMKREEHVKALEDFSQAIRLKPSYEKAYRHRAKAHTRRGQFFDAMIDNRIAETLQGLSLIRTAFVSNQYHVVGDSPWDVHDFLSQSAAERFAVFTDQYVLTAGLLAVGASMEKVSADGRPPLLIACQTGNWLAAKTLLDHGADPNQPSQYGISAVSSLVERGLIEDGKHFRRFLAQQLAQRVESLLKLVNSGSVRLQEQLAGEKGRVNAAQKRAERARQNSALAWAAAAGGVDSRQLIRDRSYREFQQSLSDSQRIFDNAARDQSDRIRFAHELHVLELQAESTWLITQINSMVDKKTAKEILSKVMKLLEANSAKKP